MPVSEDEGADVIAGTLDGSGGFVVRAEEGEPRRHARAYRPRWCRHGAALRARRCSELANQVAASFMPFGDDAVALIASARRHRAAARTGLRVHHRRRHSSSWPALRRCRARHADVDHGRRQPRRAGRRFDQERRGARTAEKSTRSSSTDGTLERRGEPKVTAIMPVRGLIEILAAPFCRRALRRLRRTSARRGDRNSGRRTRSSIFLTVESLGAVRRRRRRRGGAPPRRAGRRELFRRWAWPRAPAGEAERLRGGRAGRGDLRRHRRRAIASLIAVAGPLKPRQRAALDALRKQGVAIVVLRSDSRHDCEGSRRQSACRRRGRCTKNSARPRARWRSTARRAGSSPWPATAWTMSPALAAADIVVAIGSDYADIAMASGGVTTLVKAAFGIVRTSKQAAATMRETYERNIFRFSSIPSASMPIAAGALCRCSVCCCRLPSAPPPWHYSSVRCRRRRASAAARRALWLDPQYSLLLANAGLVTIVSDSSVPWRHSPPPMPGAHSCSQHRRRPA